MGSYPPNIWNLRSSPTVWRTLLAGAIGRTVECTSLAPSVKEHHSLKHLQVSCQYLLTRFQHLYWVFSDESGWCWFIPMWGKTSLGIVQQQDLSNLKKSQMPPETRTLQGHYEAAFLKICISGHRMLSRALSRVVHMSSSPRPLILHLTCDILLYPYL